MKTSNDIGHQRPKNVGQQGHHKEDQENQTDHVTISCHTDRCFSIRDAIYSIVVIFVANSKRPGSRPTCAAKANVVICTGRISRIGVRLGES